LAICVLIAGLPFGLVFCGQKSFSLGLATGPKARLFSGQEAKILSIRCARSRAVSRSAA
jgi:hypothetical protein